MKVKTATTNGILAIQRLTKHGISHPFGDSRSVSQAFPKGIPSHVSDPFLMSDYWNNISKGQPVEHEDYFPVGWHPHRGMDILSYVKKGRGRHGDSLGNRETFASPGMQWMSVGSGVVHAEGGGTPEGQPTQGFQIWTNVPSHHKMDDPDYGTVPKEQMKVVPMGTKSRARILAGNGPTIASQDSPVVGPFRTKQPVQMIDFEIGEDDTVNFEVTQGLDTALLYVYEGKVTYNQEPLATTPSSTTKLERGSILVLDANDDHKRRISLSTHEPSQVMLFAGKKLREPIAWHGPIVMNTQQQIMETFREIQNGTFPPQRVDWDYKTYASRPTRGSEKPRPPGFQQTVFLGLL